MRPFISEASIRMWHVEESNAFLKLWTWICSDLPLPEVRSISQGLIAATVTLLHLSDSFPAYRCRIWRCLWTWRTQCCLLLRKRLRRVTKETEGSLGSEDHLEQMWAWLRLTPLLRRFIWCSITFCAILRLLMVNFPSVHQDVYYTWEASKQGSLISALLHMYLWEFLFMRLLCSEESVSLITATI